MVTYVQPFSFSGSLSLNGHGPQLHDLKTGEWAERNKMGVWRIWRRDGYADLFDTVMRSRRLDVWD